MIDSELKAKRLIRRIEKTSQSFWLFSKTKGISNSEWTNYYLSVMSLGKKLKDTGFKYNPRSSRYPVEFRELFKDVK